MTTDPIGLYVHIPFCIRKCNYCDFCSYKLDDFTKREEYIDALVKEISSYKEKNISVDTVFFGGGTPSLLSDDELRKIMNSIKEAFDISPEAEFTVEANPKTLTRDKLSLYTELGVNRISLGLQSIHENEQKILGRIHNFDDFLNSYKLVRDAGIKNVNVDLMYGIPEQTQESFEETLRTVISLSPEHISLYGLILEEGTPFFDNRDKLSLPDEDAECDMYYLAARLLKEAGYLHYEISNYAKEGCESRHNLKYWRVKEYIGVGVSAYSYFDGKRYGNVGDVSEYISDTGKRVDVTICDLEAVKYDYVMLGLRLHEGISLSEYKSLFGIDFLEEHRKKIEAYICAGLIEIRGDRLSFTERGFYVSNTILTDLL